MASPCKPASWRTGDGLGEKQKIGGVYPGCTSKLFRARKLGEADFVLWGREGERFPCSPGRNEAALTNDACLESSVAKPHAFEPWTAIASKKL